VGNMNLSLKGSHITMCKFPSHTSPSYNRLFERIKNEIEAKKRSLSRTATGSSGSRSLLQHDPQVRSHNSGNDHRDDEKTILTRTNTSRCLNTLSAACTESLIGRSLSDSTTLKEKEGNNYRHVSSLETWHLLHPGKALEKEQIRREKLGRWLRPPTVKEILCEDDLADRSLPRTEGTCSWILEVESYKMWRTSESSGLLWFHGIQGCGKSTTVAYVIHKLREEGESVVHLFCSEDRSVSSSVRINCLSQQMVEANERVAEVLDSIHQKKRGVPLMAVHAAKEVLLEALRAFQPCFLVVDALDECESQDRLDLVNVFLDAAAAVSSGVKIFCSSRNIPDLELVLGRTRISTVSEIQIVPEDIEHDIEAMIEGNIQNSPFILEFLDGVSSDFRDHVVGSLTRGAQGMFLLPKLMVSSLEKKAATSSTDEILEFLQDLPLGLYDYYLSILKRTDKRWRPLAKKIFTWVVWGKRPLSIAELQDAFLLDGKRYPKLRVSIKAACNPLVEIDNDEIRVSHSSVKRFFLESTNFKEDPIYNELVDSAHEDHLLDICVRYIFKGDFAKPQSQQKRFNPRDPTSFDCCPFARYSASNWVLHLKHASLTTRMRLVRSLQDFVSSPHFLYWIEIICHLCDSKTESIQYYIRLFQASVTELMAQPEVQLDNFLKDCLVDVSMHLSRFQVFVECWRDCLTCFPTEIHNLWPLSENSKYLKDHGQQAVFLTGSTPSRTPDQLHDSIDNSRLEMRNSFSPFFDRFVLCDYNIFLWQSLMPSVPWQTAFGFVLDPKYSFRIELISKTMETGKEVGRYGIDPAQVGSMTVSVVMRKDLRAIAMAWPKYNVSTRDPLVVKTYVWALTESSTGVEDHVIEWTDKVDPCRADLTYSNSFKNSKNAVAFTTECANDYLWTAGGKYELRTGLKVPAPELFLDPDISALTFCSNGTAIAGVREEGLELYDIPRFRRVAYADGNCSILELSPNGKFVLFLRRPYNEVELRTGNGTGTESALSKEDICLLSREKCSKLWRSDTSSESGPFNLELFYNSGGLHTFSANERILVICVPTLTDWSLLCFDLAAADVVGSRWTLDYSGQLLGRPILCIALCPIHERRLYILDGFGVMHIVQVTQGMVSTIQTVERPMILSSPRSSTHKLFTTTTTTRGSL